MKKIIMAISMVFVSGCASSFTKDVAPLVFMVAEPEVLSQSPMLNLQAVTVTRESDLGDVSNIVATMQTNLTYMEFSAQGFETGLRTYLTDSGLNKDDAVNRVNVAVHVSRFRYNPEQEAYNMGFSTRPSNKPRLAAKYTFTNLNGDVIFETEIKTISHSHFMGSTLKLPVQTMHFTELGNSMLSSDSFASSEPAIVDDVF
ncbi:MAG: hypothetical protein HOH19_01585 [Kordiimonadaceae bacterium]|jgi:hypothetical protein|nr:hypothetical protein [Kordiimonadaceae bacterium]MBT6031240.1 hypothetical protein [Kordiimonadaceae bacterium]